jgi:hypothetical protein
VNLQPYALGGEKYSQRGRETRKIKDKHKKKTLTLSSLAKKP